MPQWDFLNFIAGQAQQYSGFHLMMQAEVVDLVAEDNKVVGVISKTQSGIQKIHADLTIGARRRGTHRCAEQAPVCRCRIWARPWMFCGCAISRHKDDPSTPFGARSLAR